MASERIPMERIGDAISQIVEEASANQLKATEKAVKATVIDRWGEIIKRTPVDTGRARGNWFIGQTVQSSKTGRRNRTKGASYVSQSFAGRNVLGEKWFLYNNLPYIRVLEFGGYPKSVKRGTRNPKTGKYEIRSRGGYSKQAPRGMVRVSLLRFPSILKRNWRKAQDGIR